MLIPLWRCGNIVQTIPERWQRLMDNFFGGCGMGIQSTHNKNLLSTEKKQGRSANMKVRTFDHQTENINYCI